MHPDQIIGAIIGAVFVWVVALEFRLRKAQTQIIASDRKAKDEEIAKNASSLSDAELDALLDKDLRPKH